MKKTWSIAFALLVALATSSAFAETTSFVNVNVLPMSSSQVLPEQTVIVTDGRIVTIGATESTPVPEGSRLIDGTDRFLMPGLAEMHGHLPGIRSTDLDRILALNLANGVTLIRGMLGQPSHLALRDEIENGLRTGPRLVTSGPSFNGRSVSSAGQAAEMVREQKAAGYDFLKIHPGLSRAEFHAIAETANDLAIPFAGHVPEDVGLTRALAAGIATIDHFDGYMAALMPAHDDPSGGVGGFFGVFIADEAQQQRIPELAAATVAAGTWNVPTESLFEHVVAPEPDAEALGRRPEMAYMPSNAVAIWKQSKRDVLSDASYSGEEALHAIEIRRQLIRAIHDAGGGLLLGSDSPQIFNVPGFAIHHELSYLVDAGLSPYEALKTGTLNPARFLDEAEEFGTVEVGRRADLLLLDANPLEDIGNSRRIHGVMTGGRWFPKAELEALLRRLKR